MTTPSIDLPTSINNLFDFAIEDIPSAGPAAAAPAPAPRAGLDPSGGVQNFAGGGMVRKYAEGGMVTEEAVPPVDAGVVPEGGAGLAVPGAGAGPGVGQDIEGEAKALIRERPDVAAQMLQAAEQALQMGEFTEEMIEVGGKMAIVVSKNPEMYPKMLQRLTAMGAKDLPQEYDPEFLFTVIMMWLAWQDKDKIRAGGEGVTAGEGGSSIPRDQIQDFSKGGYVKPFDHAANGGMVTGPGTDTSDGVPAMLSNNEYVIPAHIVKAKGKEFFDNMLAKYDPDRQV